MNNNVLFSVVCPFFNGKKYLTKAIESVLKQTYLNWELILVDDGSTDGSQKIAKSFLSDKVHYYKNDNHGVLYSRYYGVNKSLGRYIIFLDCDDLLPNNALEVYKNIVESINPDIVFSNISTFSNEGYEPRIYLNKAFKILDNNNKMSECFFDNRFGYYHSAACFKRAIFNNHKLPEMFWNHVYTEDLIDTYFLICDANSIVLITDTLYLYRKHSQSKSKANMSQTDCYQCFLSYNYIYEDIYHRQPYNPLNQIKELINELSLVPMLYFVFDGVKDDFLLFKKRAKEIRNSFLYKNFSNKHKFVGKRYILIKILLFLKFYRFLYRII